MEINTSSETTAMCDNEARSPTALVPTCSATEVLLFGAAFAETGHSADEDLGSTVVPESFTLLDSPNSVVEIACGMHHVLFRLDDGSVLSYGNNEFGQLGRNEENLSKPGPVPHLVGGAVQMSCGSHFNVVVTSRQRIMVWGANDYGQLGLGHTEQQSEPTYMNLLEIVQVCAGRHHALALTQDGVLFSWGRNDFGQLGLGKTTSQETSPQRIASLSGLPVAAVSAGGFHSCVLSVSGAVYTFGCNQHGQLGTGTTEDSSYPKHIRPLRYERVVQLVCGNKHTCALTKDGRLFIFGANDLGQLGDCKPENSSTPTQIAEFTGKRVLRVACGFNHTLAVCDRRVYSWGSNSNGELGRGSGNDVKTAPSAIASITSPVQSLFAGGKHSFVQLCDSQSGYAWVAGPPIRPKSLLSLSYERIKCKEIKSLAKLVGLRHVFNDSTEFNNRTQRFSDLIIVTSSIACLNASFLKSKNHGVDMDAVRDGFLALKSRARSDSKLNEALLQLTELVPDLPSSPPDIESMRVYIILPYFHAFEQCTSDNYETLLVPYARAVCSLVDNANTVLTSWWCSFEARHIAHLVRVYLSCVRYAIEHKTQLVMDDSHPISKDQENLNHCLKLLHKLFKTNQKSNKVPLESFYVDSLQSHIDIRVDYLQWIFQQKPRFSFCDYPFIFDAQVKTMLLKTDAKIRQQVRVEQSHNAQLTALLGMLTGHVPDMDNVHPFLTLNVTRDRIVDDTVAQLMSSATMDLGKPLKVQFAGEEADDAGGVKKEFFMLLFLELLHPKYGMFYEEQQSRLVWFSGYDFVEASMYATVGMLVGLAIYNDVLIDFHFPLALYKKLLHKDVTLEDFKELNPTEGRSLEEVLDHEGDDVEDVFGLVFDAPVTMFDTTTRVPLRSGGSDESVTTSNRAEFVSLYVQFKLCTHIDTAFEAFAAGFNRVMTSKLLQFFQPSELQEMVEGHENYDWDTFRRVTEYRGEYWANHPTIQSFWRAFFDLSLEEKKKFLLFLSGSDRIPLLGMDQVKMTIQPAADKALPVAHTCFNLLDLPNNSNEKVLKEKLKTVIEYNRGFSLV